VTHQITGISYDGGYAEYMIAPASARTGVRSMNETFPLERASEGYDRMMSGKARFRVVLSISP
jgi:D-arabinose 1-dehydrogenase-like Zn-dependent alcohol dehydrogenase